MARSEQEKVHLEHQAAKLFMRWYEKNTGNKIRHIWHNEPRKPDVSCYLDGERLDLEIAHLYGSSEEAMQILNRELTEETQAELEKQSLLSDTQERLLAALNRILANKSLKYYKTSQVWLVIRNANPAWSKEKIVALQDSISIPENHPFQQIWIVCDMAGSTGIVQLYPDE